MVYLYKHKIRGTLGERVSTAVAFFGGDWDDEVSTQVRDESVSISSPVLATSARTCSGTWKKIHSDEEIPLVTRLIDPKEILDVLQEPPYGFPFVERPVEIQPWDFEVVQTLHPPVIWPLPVLPLARTRARLPNWALFAIAAAVGFACAAAGFFGIVSLSV